MSITPRWHSVLKKNSPKETRRKYNTGDIWINRAQCTSCGEVLTSTHKHDYVVCSCGDLSVDGGSWYLRRKWLGKSGFIEMSEGFDETECGDELT